MVSAWDRIVVIYEIAASRSGTPYADFGKGMLTVITELRDHLDSVDVQPGTAMYTLILRISQNKFRSVHVSWISQGDYHIYLTPEPGQKPEREITVPLDQVVSTVKEYLQYLGGSS
jgi:hypothetical protein